MHDINMQATKVYWLQVKLEQEAMAAISGRAEDPRGFHAAMLVMEAVILSFLWGHLPPPRAGVLLNMHPPSFQGPCTNKDCRQPSNCFGNRVFYGTTNKQVYMHLPHHKEEAKWGYKCPRPYLLPESMLVLLLHYLGWARARLLQVVSPCELCV